MMSSRRKDERVHKNAIFNRLTAGVSSAFKHEDSGPTNDTHPQSATDPALVCEESEYEDLKKV